MSDDGTPDRDLSATGAAPSGRGVVVVTGGSAVLAGASALARRR